MVISIDQDIGKGGFTAQDFTEKIKASEGQEIILHINSAGGSLIDAFASYDFAQFKEANIVAAEITGVAASAATIFACKAKYVVIGEHSYYFIHNPQNSSASAEDLAKMKEDILDIYMAKIQRSAVAKKPTREYISKLMDDETLLTAEEALNLGFCDMIRYEEAVAASAKDKIKELTAHKMEKTETIKKTGWFNALVDWFKTTNMLEITLEDGTPLYVYAEDGEIEGKKVVIVKDGEPSDEPAPNGDHLLKDGRKITVEGGVITEVTVDKTIKPESEMDIKNMLEKGFGEITNKLTETNDAVQSLNDRVTALETNNKAAADKTEADAKATEAEKYEAMKKENEELKKKLDAQAAGKLDITNFFDRSADAPNSGKPVCNEPQSYLKFLNAQMRKGFDVTKQLETIQKYN